MSPPDHTRRALTHLGERGDGRRIVALDGRLELGDR
jgi:hypothetical protein